MGVSIMVETNDTGLKEKYLDLLAKKYDNEEKVATEIMNLESILDLPKGTEHFVSDLHGEYQAFQHVLRNGSGKDRKSTRLNSSHVAISYAVFCLKKKKKKC